MKLSLLLNFLIVAATALTVPSNAHPLLVDVAHSKMTVAVWKQGLFAFAADNHHIDAPLVSGSFDPAGHIVQITVDAAKMQVLDPQLAPDKRAQVQSNMVGPQVLDVQKYPQITFRSTSVGAASGDRLTIVGDLTLHGQTHPVTIHATKLDDRHYKGSASIKQTAFGITPIRIAGGLVKVKDDVDISFDIVLKP